MFLTGDARLFPANVVFIILPYIKKQKITRLFVFIDTTVKIINVPLKALDTEHVSRILFVLCQSSISRNVEESLKASFQ